MVSRIETKVGIRVKIVWESRVVRIEHLQARTGRSYVPLQRRTLKLSSHAYLYVKKMPLRPHVFLLGRKAVPVLADEGVARPEHLFWRVGHSEITDLFLKHSLMVTDFLTMLKRASQDSPLEVVHWQDGRPLLDRVAFTNSFGKKKPWPVWPDSFFTLQDSRREDGANLSHFFLEADRATSGGEFYVGSTRSCLFRRRTR